MIFSTAYWQVVYKNGPDDRHLLQDGIMRMSGSVDTDISRQPFRKTLYTITYNMQDVKT